MMLSSASLAPSIALVIADGPTAERIGAKCREKGLEITAVATPLNAIQSLLALGDRVAVVVAQETSRWARGLFELMADEFPAVKRVSVE